METLLKILASYLLAAMLSETIFFNPLANDYSSILTWVWLVLALPGTMFSIWLLSTIWTVWTNKLNFTWPCIIGIHNYHKTKGLTIVEVDRCRDCERMNPKWLR